MFDFRLKSVRRIRQADRDERLSSLAEAVRGHELLAEQLRQLDTSVQQLRSLAAQLLAPGEIDVDALLKRARHEALLAAQTKQLLVQMQQVEGEIDTRRTALIEADRNVKVLDRLHDKQRQEYELAQQRTEQRQLDEAATIQWSQRDSQR